MSIKTNFLILIILISSSQIYADDQSFNWSIKGFGTIGLIGTDSHEIGFKRDLSQVRNVKKPWGFSTDSRLGIQIDVDINHSLHATTQWIARDHSGNFFEQNLEWAFLRWGASNNLDIRAGRMGADVFLLSDYRNVGYAYPWMRPPHEFYANLPFYHFDGIDIKKTYFFDNSNLSLKVFAGYSFNQLPTVFSELFEAETPLIGGNIVYQHNNWRTRIGYAYLRIVSEGPTQQLTDLLSQPDTNFAIPGISNLIPKLRIKNSDIHFYSLGEAYDNGTWFAQAEASYIDTQTSYFPDSANAYLSIGRRFSSISLYSLYGISKTFHKHIPVPNPTFPSPQLQQLTQIVENTINNNGVDEQSISLGVRWGIHPKIAVKAQWSHYWLGNNGAALWEKPISNKTPNTVNVWSFGFDFIF